MTGDADTLSGHAAGGNDWLTGGDFSTNILRGNGQLLTSDAQGGSDILAGGAHSCNRLIGDADRIEDRAIAETTS